MGGKKRKIADLLCHSSCSLLWACCLVNETDQFSPFSHDILLSRVVFLENNGIFEDLQVR